MKPTTRAPGGDGRGDAEDRILEDEHLARVDRKLLGGVEIDVRRGLRPAVAHLDGRIDVRLETIVKLGLLEREFQALARRVRADAARLLEPVEKLVDARHRLEALREAPVDLDPGLLEEALRQRPPQLGADDLHDLAAGETGEAAAHLLGRDRVSDLGEMLRVDLRREDF